MYDLIEHVLMNGDNREIKLAKEAGSQLDEMESEITALRSQLAEAQAERDRMQVAITEYVEANTNEGDLAAFRKLQAFARTDARGTGIILQKGNGNEN